MFNLRFIAITILFASILISCRKEKEPAAVNATQKPESRGTIVAVGDSLTAGQGVSETDAYPARLERKLNETGYKWRVVNAGISGETSTGTLARIDWILKLQPDIVILETGANDGLRGQDPELTHRNIDRIVTTLQEKNVIVVLTGMQMLTNMGSLYRDKFVAIYPRVAKERKLILVPFFLDKVAGEENLNLSDGIHPNPQGYAIVTDTLYPYVVQAIKLKTGN